ncbi:hypothetical protein E4U42_001675 [Claviceps africana]|uniref:Galactosyl transferase GMA12/MNN10 family protein n=1 Tax=Claviceps africana TaxID=83212 RepID=A0A8K0J8Y4_9HYPO|nr:hypothetical protein E4U42_001675 [Claviceps africana]
MVEDKLRLLLLKGSLTTRAQRFILANTADVHDEQSRIGKVSIMFGATKSAYERALQSHKRHNRQHGYPMFIQRVDVMDGFWTKPAFIHYMILRELRKPESQRLQWLFWFDADTVVLNYNVPLEIFLPPENDETLNKINVLVADDWNGLNNGIFGIRVTQWAAELFAGILAFRDFEPDTHLSFADQSAMEILLKKRKGVNHVGKVPQRWFNAYPTDDENPQDPWVHPGDFLVHFAGRPNRETHMNHWLDISEQLLEKWNKPLTQTTYLEEIKQFWNHTKTVQEARKNRWEKETEHLQTALKNAIITLNNTPKNDTPSYQSMVQALKEAEDYKKKIQKYKGDFMKEDLHRIKEVKQKLNEASKVLSDDAAKTQAALEEQRKKEEEKKKEEGAQQRKEHDSGGTNGVP